MTHTQVRKIPQELQAVRAPVVSTPTQQVARVDNDVVGECPVCHNQMETSVANGIEVYICKQDTVVMPVPDDRV